MDLENGSFEDWNQGTLIVNPIDGAELADSWFMHLGAAQPTTTVARNLGPVSHGTYSLGWTPSSFLGGNPNTTTYIYQDITNYTDYQGITITLTGDLSTSTIGATGQIFLDDGISVSYSPPTTAVATGVLETVTVIKAISPVATQLRVGFIPNFYRGQNADNFFISLALDLQINDAITFTESFIKILNNALAVPLSDSLVVSDTLVPPTGPVQIGKGANDGVRIQEWLQVTKRSNGNWGS